MSLNKVVIACFLLTACGDLSIPAELAEPQLLALVADPPGIAADQETALSVLVAGPEGLMTPMNETWTLADPQAATLTEGVDTWTIRAPADATEATSISLNVTIELDGGITLQGTRSLQIGAAQTQPSITGVLVDNEAVAEGSAMQLGTAREHELRLEVSPAPGDGAIFSWFATVGELTLYRRSPATIETTDADSGVLIVVYRDGLGGVDFRSMNVDVGSGQ